MAVAEESSDDEEARSAMFAKPTKQATTNPVDAMMNSKKASQLLLPNTSARLLTGDLETQTEENQSTSKVVLITVRTSLSHGLQ